MPNYKMSLLCCGGTGCRASESVRIVERLREEIAAAGMDNDVQVVVTGCFGFCEKGPIVKVIPDNTFYTNVKPEDAEEIVKEHVVKGRKVTRLLYEDPDTRKHISDSKHMGFYQKQLRIALRNCGFINPENIDEYIARDGYEALAKVLQGTPQEAIETVKKSGLRGRGGGGFPTGLKWEIASKSPGPEKYVVCNADEGDPGAGAFMDRSILESDPNSVIEAMAICGYCIGASKGLVYIRAEYPLAVKRLQIAMKQARDYGLLGDDILGSGFNFDIEIRYGAGAFVCGEETALIHSMEGKRGEPTVKPPFPAESGYLGKPTNVNPGDLPQGTRVVCIYRYRKVQGYQGVCTGRQDQQRGPHRGSDGYDPPRGHIRYRRRYQGGQRVQGRPDRRSFRRPRSTLTLPLITTTSQLPAR